MKADYSLALYKICGKLEEIKEKGEAITGISGEKADLMLASILRDGAQFVIQSKDSVICDIVEELIHEATENKMPELRNALLLIH